MRKLFLAGMSWLFVGQLSAASIPAKITYQGTLKQSGVPANGTISMEFKIINADDSFTYWNSQPINVPVTQGLFSQTLSPLNALNPQNPLDWENTTPYIEVILNPGSSPITLAPAEPITTTMFSLVAGTVIDGSVVTQKLADGAVTTAKLADASVTTAQLADASVTTTQLANAAVTTAQLANASVTTAQLANASVTTAQIAPGAVTAAQLDASVYTIPAGMIAMFATSCPAGWTIYAPLRGNFPVGEDDSHFGSQATGGALTHSHTTPNHTHTLALGSSFGAGCGAGPVAVVQGQPAGAGLVSVPSGNFCGYTQVESVTTNSGSGTTSDASSLPPYQTVVFCVKS